MDAKHRRLSFEALVCQGIWLLILYAAGANPRSYAINLRAHMISYFDEVGNQSDLAKEYRREEAFPELRR